MRVGCACTAGRSARKCRAAASRLCVFFGFYFCGDGKFCRFLPEEDFVTALGDFKVVVLVVRNFDVAELQHLQKVIVPMLERCLAADSESFELVVTLLDDFVVERSFENVGGH